MNEIKEKKYVSTGELIALQLWIYYPLLIIGIFMMLNYKPINIYSAIENVFLKIGNLDVNGMFVCVLFLSLLLNLLTFTLIFIILLPKSKYTYGGKNGWYSVWWNFGVQTGALLFLICNIVPFIGIAIFLSGPVLIFLFYGITISFIGTVGFYFILNKLKSGE